MVRKTLTGSVPVGVLAGCMWLMPIFAQATTVQASEVPELTVAQITRIVLAHNPGLQAARSGVDAARAGVQTAGALHNPRLEWQQGPWQAQPPLPGIARQQARGWSVAQTIDNPWLRGARVEAAESGLRISDRQLSGARNDLVARVRLRAYEALLHQVEAEASAGALTLLEQVRERVRVRVETGESARYDIIKADAEVIHARERQKTAALQAEHALLELNRLAAGQLPARWKLVASFSDGLDLPDLAQLQALAERLRLPLEYVAAEALLAFAGQAEAKPLTQQVAGSPAVAEPSALAAAARLGRAQLLGPRLRSANATCALARIDSEPCA